MKPDDLHNDKRFGAGNVLPDINNQKSEEDEVNDDSDEEEEEEEDDEDYPLVT